jgi:hypothetical protein
MSRSRRHTPKFGMTTATSEKDDKTRAHRRVRRAGKAAMTDATTEMDNVTPAKTEHPRSGRWIFAKDGKRWSTRPDAKDMRK